MTQPYIIVSSTSGFSIRILSSRGALRWSYSSRVYFRKLHYAVRIRRSTSMDRSALWLTFPPRYANSFVWLYTWPAASTLNVAVDSGITFILSVDRMGREYSSVIGQIELDTTSRQVLTNCFDIYVLEYCHLFFLSVRRRFRRAK